MKRTAGTAPLLTSCRSRVEGTPVGINEYRRLDFFTLTAEPDQVDYVHVNAGGVPAIWAAPVGAATDRAIAYFHGGAYAQGSAASYRRFCGHLAKAVGCRVLIVDYRLARRTRIPRRSAMRSRRSGGCWNKDSTRGSSR